MWILGLEENVNKLNNKVLKWFLDREIELVHDQ